MPTHILATCALTMVVGWQLHNYCCLLQSNLLVHVLVHTWRSPSSCQRLMESCLSQWMQPTHQQHQQHQQPPPLSNCTSNGVSSSSNSNSSSSSNSSSRHAVQQPYQLRRSLPRLPHWQLKGLLIAAGRFGVLPAEVQHEAGRTAQLQQQRRLQESILHEQRLKQQQQQRDAVAESEKQAVQHAKLREQLRQALRPADAAGTALALNTQQQQQQLDAAAGASQTMAPDMDQQQQQQQRPEEVATAAVAVAAEGQEAVNDAHSRLSHTHSSSSSTCGPNSGSSGSSSGGGDGGQAVAAAFISTILQELTPELFAEWRADLALALLWSAARLGVQPSQVG